MGLPLSFVYAFVVFVAVALLLVRWLRRWRRRAADLLVNDFTRAFPGRCLLCSWRRHTELMSGLDLPPPEPHPCPEGRSMPMPLPAARTHAQRIER